MGKEKEKKPVQKERNTSILLKKKKSLAESGKGSWFGQTPSPISVFGKDREQAKILGASSLKIKVNASACCDQDPSLESGGSNEEKGKCDTKGPVA